MLRNWNGIQQVFTGILVPFSGEFQTVVEEGEVDTYVVAFLLFPRKVISHVVTCHYSLIHVFTDVFVTEFTIAGAYLEHVDNVSVEGEKSFLVKTPS